MIGQEGSRDISGRSITQENITERKFITHGNIITTDITDPRKIPPRSGSFSDRRKADTDVHARISDQNLSDW